MCESVGCVRSEGCHGYSEDSVSMTEHVNNGQYELTTSEPPRDRTFL